MTAAHISDLQELDEVTQSFEQAFAEEMQQFEQVATERGQYWIWLEPEPIWAGSWFLPVRSPPYDGKSSERRFRIALPNGGEFELVQDWGRKSGFYDHLIFLLATTLYYDRYTARLEYVGDGGGGLHRTAVVFCEDFPKLIAEQITTVLRLIDEPEAHWHKRNSPERLLYRERLAALLIDPVKKLGLPRLKPERRRELRDELLSALAVVS